MSGTLGPDNRSLFKAAGFVSAPSLDETQPAAAPDPAALHAQLHGKTHHSHKQRLLLGVFAVAFAAAALQIGLTAAFNGRFMPGVKVASVSIGGMTRPEAQEVLKNKADSYRLKLKVDGKSYNLKPEEAGASYNLNATLDQAYLVGRSSKFVPAGLYESLNEGEMSYSYSIDQKVQQQLVEKLVTSSGKPPVDASIAFENGNPVVKPDENGAAINPADLIEAIEAQISITDDGVLEMQPRVQAARIKAADVKPAIEKTKEILAVPITITYQGKTFKPTTAQISEWIRYGKTTGDEKPGLITKVNPDGVKNFLQSVATAINVNPVNRKIRVQNGESTETQAGKEGLQLDQDALTSQIVGALGANKAFAAEAPTKKVPFQTEYNRSVSLDYVKYIEISLGQQRLWVYQDNKVIHEAPITSGATGAGFATVTGLFSIQAKERNRNLNGYAIGYDYNVFVKYWMPFYGNFGMHDASWRTSFGGQDYYYNGSHGCVNLPPATAAFIYGWAAVGTPVWVHQ